MDLSPVPYPPRSTAPDRQLNLSVSLVDPSCDWRVCIGSPELTIVAHFVRGEPWHGAKLCHAHSTLAGFTSASTGMSGLGVRRAQWLPSWPARPEHQASWWMDRQNPESMWF